MSESEAVKHAPSAAAPDSEARLDAGAAGNDDTAGALLREARRVQGLDIETLAALLKVPAHKLQALEQNQFDLLPDPVFARALACSMCRILKLDPIPVLQRLPAITAFKATSQNRGINTPFRARGGRHAASPWTYVSRPAALVGLALLLGALILVFLPSIQQTIARYRQDGQGTVTAKESAGPASVTTTVITQVSGGNEGAGGIAAPSSAPLAPAEAPAFVSTPATSTASLSLATAADAMATPLVTFSATGDSRVKVTDAKGVVVLDRALRAGESAGTSGALPLAAVVSRAEAIQVQVRGQAFDLGAVTRNHVARFEVK